MQAAAPGGMEHQHCNLYFRYPALVTPNMVAATEVCPGTNLARPRPAQARYLTGARNIHHGVHHGDGAHMTGCRPSQSGDHDFGTHQQYGGSTNGGIGRLTYCPADWSVS